jgi:uncharacterized protein YehS (DUF1456 family)
MYQKLVIFKDFLNLKYLIILKKLPLNLQLKNNAIFHTLKKARYRVFKGKPKVVRS